MKFNTLLGTFDELQDRAKYISSKAILTIKISIQVANFPKVTKRINSPPPKKRRKKILKKIDVKLGTFLSINQSVELSSGLYFYRTSII